MRGSGDGDWFGDTVRLVGRARDALFRVGGRPDLSEEKRAALGRHAARLCALSAMAGDAIHFEARAAMGSSLGRS